jgi:RNA polymerase sigma-70 factor (ECF subfamily)
MSLKTRSSSTIAKQDQQSAPAGRAPQQRRYQDDHDVQLMLALRDGDDEAFVQLVERNTPKVHGLIYRFLGSPDQVDDLTQEVFLRVYRTAKRYKPTAKFSTWLYRVTANLCFNVIRSRKKGNTYQLDFTDSNNETVHREIADNSAGPPWAGIDALELQSAVAKALDQLPENQKLAIILNKYEDKSYDDIAEVLDCSTMAVKSLLSRARCNLKDLLARYLRD